MRSEEQIKILLFKLDEEGESLLEELNLLRRVQIDLLKWVLGEL